jgi:hypothetical protein
VVIGDLVGTDTVTTQGPPTLDTTREERKPLSGQKRRPTPGHQRGLSHGHGHTSDPQKYGIAYATALFSYDTRTQSEATWEAGLAAGLDTTADVRADNTEDLANRTLPAAVWQAMASSKQHATFAVTRVWVPRSGHERDGDCRRR